MIYLTIAVTSPIRITRATEAPLPVILYEPAADDRLRK
jgi:hypothetical protein